MKNKLKYTILFLLPILTFANIPRAYHGPINAEYAAVGDEVQEINKNIGYVSAKYVQLADEKFYVHKIEEQDGTILVEFTNGDACAFKMKDNYRAIIFAIDGELVIFNY